MPMGRYMSSLAEDSPRLASVRSTTHSGTMSVLMTNSGDILVDFVEAGSSFGQVTLSAYGDIREGPTTDSALDVSADFVLVYAKDNVANGEARLETSQHGQV